VPRFLLVRPAAQHGPNGSLLPRTGFGLRTMSDLNIARTEREAIAAAAHGFQFISAQFAHRLDHFPHSSVRALQRILIFTSSEAPHLVFF